MSNEIEKTFFDAFGIRTYYKYLLIDETSRNHNEKLFDKTNFIDFVKSGKDYLLLKVIKYYPEITDHILLELICIANQYEDYPISTNIKNIQARTLRLLLKVKKYLKDTYSHQGWHNGLVRKVRTLFKEENKNE